MGFGHNTYFGKPTGIEFKPRRCRIYPQRGKLQLNHLYYFNLSKAAAASVGWLLICVFMKPSGTVIPITIGLRGSYIQSYGDVPFSTWPTLAKDLICGLSA
ncbi:MAG: hypothetical protein R2788_18085 [Saprospiraceae bacterium]